MNLSDKIQEWLADRVSFVQYPNIRRVKPPSDRERGNARKKMTVIDAMLVLMFAGMAGIVGLTAIAVGCFILYVIFAG